MANFANPGLETNLSSWRAGKTPTELSAKAWQHAATIGGSDGDAVASWADDTGTGNTATQGNASFKPLYKTGIFSGGSGGSLPSVRGDGTDDYLQKTTPTNGPSGNSPLTLFQVVKPISHANVDTLINIGGSAVFAIAMHFIYRSGSSAWLFDDYGHSDGATFGTVSDGTVYILVGTYDGVDLRTTFRNGTQAGTKTRGMSFTNSAYDIFGMVSDGIFANADLGESGFIDSCLTGQNLADLISYFGIFYGLTIAERGVTVTRDVATVRTGSGSLKVVSNAANSLSPVYEDINPGSTSNYVITAYAKKSDASQVTSSDCQLYYDGSALTTNYEAAASNWWKMTATVTGANAIKKVGIVQQASKTIYYDDFDISVVATSVKDMIQPGIITPAR